ncbi:DNA alkylation repair protein [Salirhabdus sp. Marseille-P4669]|uniref:DNA alkylation repair protein n=1 Tax=Salirhabdus sp. Marseille-P4669 TaxID=2042310 RepID=UPI000C7DDF1A|nr:DNA alkylation repair protein [Salirhabdus sp. Marseille-P4669]
MELIQLLVSEFEKHQNTANAVPMEKYMKNRYPFLGIKTPLRREIMKKFYKETGLLKEPFHKGFVLDLWELEEREYQNAALDYIDRSLKKLEKEDITLIEQLITTKSWWDTVDTLATKAVGKIAKDNPSVIQEKIEDWAYGEHLWLRRTAILFQLKYKENTDEELLYRFIKQNADSKEFFIQKAIGWALREYSKTNPHSVKQFIEKTPLQRLSIREGSKYLS